MPQNVITHSDAIWATQWTARDTAVSASADGSVVQWDCQTGQQIGLLPSHPLGIVSLSVSQAGDLALLNSIEGTTKLWRLIDNSVLGTHESFVKEPGATQHEPVWTISIHPKGDTYASTGGDGGVSIHSASPVDFGSRRQHFPLSGRKKPFGMALKHSPDGSKIAMASETGQIYLFDIESAQLLNTYTSHAMCVRSIAWSPDNQLLVSASDDKRLIMHDVRNSGKGGGAVASLTGHSSWVLDTSVSPDGRLAVSGSSDKTIKVWDLGARAAVSTMQEQCGVWGVSWRPKVSAAGPGAFISAGEDGSLKWWRGAGMG